MKKKNLKNLNVKKSTISSLNQQTISGGTIATMIVIRTIKEATATTCSKFMECDSIIACTANVCKPIETNTDTRPVC